MIQSLVLFTILLLFIAFLIVLAHTKMGRSYDCNDTLGGIVLVLIVVMLVINCVHFYIIIDTNITADATLAENLRLHDDLQLQIETFTDEQTLAAVMERAEKYNQDVAYGKTSAHSPWNAWSYPAKIYDNLEFVNMPEG